MNLRQNILVFANIFAIVCSLVIQSECAYADDVYTFIVKKQEKKKITQWSLAEWLATKERIKLMDMWLALHTPSPYEFRFGGDLQFANPKSSSQEYRLALAAYATIIGLEVERESAYSRWNGLLNLRVFGFHDQGTNITLHAGVRSQALGSLNVQSLVAGISTHIHLIRFFGLSFNYRRLFAVSNAGSGGLKGNHLEYGAFIDFSFVRVYGGYQNERSTAGTRSAATLGTQFFF